MLLIIYAYFCIFKVSSPADALRIPSKLGKMARVAKSFRLFSNMAGFSMY
jgi:hypothetical protein